MPQVKKSENWDGVTAPALPGGWSASPGFQTANALSRSSPNSLRFFYPGGGGLIWWTGTTDQFSGNARVTADLVFTGLNQACGWDLLLRLSADTSSYYFVNLEPPGSAIDGITLFKTVQGVQTQLGSTVGVGQIALNTWYTVTLQTSGQSVLAYVRRVSDGYYYNGFSGWVPSKVVAIQTNDSSLTGPGYAGHGAYQVEAENNPLYSDNFLFEDLSPDVGILLKRRRRPAVPVPVKKKRKRGWQWFSPVLKPPPPDDSNWYQCSNDSFCQYQQACQPNPPDPAGAVCLIRYGVRGGPVVSFPQATGIYHVSEPAAQAPWPAGTWTVRLNVYALAPSGWTWDSVYICRVNTGCVNQATIASATGLGLDVSVPGVYSVSLQGVADPNADPADCFYILYQFLPGGAGPNPQVKLDQPITTPFTYFNPIDQFVPDHTGLIKSALLRQPHKPSPALRRKLRIPANLLIPQPPATGPFHPSLFRKRRRMVWGVIRRDNTPYPRGGHFLRAITDVIVGFLAKPAPWPVALFPRPRHRRPARPIPRFRRLPRWSPLTPLFVRADKAMLAKALVEENLQAAALTIEKLPGTALVVETLSGNISIVLGDVLRPIPVSVR